MDGALEKSAMRKIYMRLLPFAILSYVLAYIDRINVSFAGLTMRGDLDMPRMRSSAVWSALSSFGSGGI
jgi:MFS transporter, ACS family, tartrate transporter